MQQYKDDLLSSCLQLVLSIPSQMVQSELDNILPSVEVQYVVLNDLYYMCMPIVLGCYSLCMYRTILEVVPKKWWVWVTGKAWQSYTCTTCTIRSINIVFTATCTCTCYNVSFVPILVHHVVPLAQVEYHIYMYMWVHCEICLYYHYPYSCP